jgi:spermidine synthase
VERLSGSIDASRRRRRLAWQQALVREPLLDVLRISADFRPAYDPLLRMAMAVGRSDPQAARSLLGELDRLAPARGEAAQGLRQLAAATP